MKLLDILTSLPPAVLLRIFCSVLYPTLWIFTLIDNSYVLATAMSIFYHSVSLTKQIDPITKPNKPILHLNCNDLITLQHRYRSYTTHLIGNGVLAADHRFRATILSNKMLISILVIDDAIDNTNLSERYHLIKLIILTNAISLQQIRLCCVRCNINDLIRYTRMTTVADQATRYVSLHNNAMVGGSDTCKLHMPLSQLILTTFLTFPEYKN